jgi:hypothetical protein
MRTTVAILFVAGLILGIELGQAADVLPSTLDDDTFWRLIANFSEPDGAFRYENLLSNEASYQVVIPALKRVAQPGGAYVGVGPEQNFTYIAALEPKIAFIVDIRGRNTLELLMYKALFEISPDRADFVSQLFSRKRPTGLDTKSTAQELFSAFESPTCDMAMLGRTVKRVNDRLMLDHHFPLTVDDQNTIQHVLEVFCARGPQIDYGFVNAPSNLSAPSYSDLMTATDGRGQNWSYLANEANFMRVHGMQLNNLIVPLTGDFGGMRTLRAVGAYLKRHNVTLSVFYVSNVEQYLVKEQQLRFRTNVSMMPMAASSVIIRFMPPNSTVLEWVNGFLYKRGLFHLLEK